MECKKLLDFFYNYIIAQEFSFVKDFEKISAPPLYGRGLVRRKKPFSRKRRGFPSPTPKGKGADLNVIQNNSPVRQN